MRRDVQRWIVQIVSRFVAIPSHVVFYSVLGFSMVYHSFGYVLLSGILLRSMKLVFIIRYSCVLWAKLLLSFPFRRGALVILLLDTLFSILFCQILTSSWPTLTMGYAPNRRSRGFVFSYGARRSAGELESGGLSKNTELPVENEGSNLTCLSRFALEVFFVYRRSVFSSFNRFALCRSRKR